MNMGVHAAGERLLTDIFGFVQVYAEIVLNISDDADDGSLADELHFFVPENVIDKLVVIRLVDAQENEDVEARLNSIVGHHRDEEEYPPPDRLNGFPEALVVWTGGVEILCPDKMEGKAQAKCFLGWNLSRYILN